MSRYRFQIASDVVRDGMGVELIDGTSGNVVAEVFRSDADNTLTFRSIVDGDLPVSLIEQMLEIAKCELDPFEDGSSLSDARNHLRISPRKRAFGGFY